jgi:hypothetical protein
MVLRVAVEREQVGQRLRAVFRVVDAAGAPRLGLLGYPSESLTVTSLTAAEQTAAIAHLTAQLAAQIRAAGWTVEP